MKELVLDTSATLAWAFADETKPAAEALLRELQAGRTAWVPSLWHLEVANAIVCARKRGRIDQAGAEMFFAMLQGVGIEVDDQTMALAWAKTFELSGAYGLSVYDAAYLELALRKGLPLVTLDHALEAACTRAGVKVLL